MEVNILDNLDLVFKLDDTSSETGMMTSKYDRALEYIDSSNGHVTVAVYSDGYYYKQVDASGGLDKEDTKILLRCWLDQIRSEQDSEQYKN